MSYWWIHPIKKVKHVLACCILSLGQVKARFWKYTMSLTVLGYSPTLEDFSSVVFPTFGSRTIRDKIVLEVFRVHPVHSNDVLWGEPHFYIFISNAIQNTKVQKSKCVSMKRCSHWAVSGVETSAQCGSFRERKVLNIFWSSGVFSISLARLP